MKLRKTTNLYSFPGFPLTLDFGLWTWALQKYHMILFTKSNGCEKFEKSQNSTVDHDYCSLFSRV